MKYVSVAIDGPSGAGKSTVARAAAAQLGYVYVDTGAMYRTIGLAVCRRGISGEDTEGIRSVLPDIRVGIPILSPLRHRFLSKKACPFGSCHRKNPRSRLPKFARSLNRRFYFPYT